MATRAKDKTKVVVDLLGGPKVFDVKIKDPEGLQRALRGGFPYRSFESVVKALGVTTRELADVIGVAPRTLVRRKNSKRLSPTESDRLYRVAHVTWLAADVLGSLEKGRTWLRRPNQALGGESPIDLLDTEIGERQVEALLYRIGFGVFS